MIKKTLSFVLVVFSVCSIGIASEKGAGNASVVLVNRLQYDAGLASSAVYPTDVCSIPFGTDDANVGGDSQDSKRQAGGAPTAYVPLADGSFWVLDTINQKVKHFGADGKLISCFPFPESGPKKFIFMKDLAVIPSGGMYLYNSTQGIVVRVDDKGVSQVRIEGLPDSREIGVDSKGNLLVSNPRMRSLMRFSPAGELLEKFSGKDLLTPMVDSADQPLGMKFNEQEAELFRAEKASPTVIVPIAKFPLRAPKERKAHFVAANVLGSDAKKNVYIELIACDKSGVIHQHGVLRLSQDGKTLAQADLIAFPFLYPRKKMVTPDGRIFGFRSDNKSWIPISYSLP